MYSPFRKKIFLADAIDRYLVMVEANSLYSSRTIEKYRESSVHLLRLMGNVDIRTLNDESVSELKQKMSQIKPRPPGPSRKNSMLVVLKNILKQLRGSGEDVCDPSRIKLFKIPAKDVQFLRKEQIRLIANATNPGTITGLRLRAIILALFSTGCRISELLSLDREQFEEDSGIVRNVRTKGGKTNSIIFNDASRRAIRKYLDRRKDSCAALFATTHTDVPKRLQVNDVERSLRNLGKKLGLQVNLRPHLLRKSAATHMFREGVPLGVISKFLGHANSQVTMKYYLGQMDLEDVQKNHARVMDIDFDEEPDTS